MNVQLFWQNSDLRVHHFLPTGAPSLGLRLVSTSTYNCLDWTLTYECTVTGGLGGGAVWTGTAINCPNDETIFLDYWYFTDTDEIFRICNGTIVQSLSVQDNLYTSQLSVTVTHDAAGKMIMCFYDGTDSTSTSQFSTQIPGIITRCQSRRKMYLQIIVILRYVTALIKFKIPNFVFQVYLHHLTTFILATIISS